MAENPLYLRDPIESCIVCGSNLRDESSRTYALHGCPLECELPDPDPKDAA